MNTVKLSGINSPSTWSVALKKKKKNSSLKCQEIKWISDAIEPF